MKTAFSASQLQQPQIARTARVIGSCVRHGFCPQTCPTYILSGDENDSPRGRIDLIRAMLENGGIPDARTVNHLDRCLSCLGCETTCAARLEYRRLIDHARDYIETHYRRPWGERWMRAFIASVLPEPRRLRRALAVARLSTPLHGLLPRRLRAMTELAPPQPADPSVGPGLYPAIGPTRRRVALLAGCVQQVLGETINQATVRLLTRLGCEVVVSADHGCCGALPLHMGRAAQARVYARDCLAAWEAERAGNGLDAIVITASGCGTTVKDYALLFADEPEWRARAERLAPLACDVSELLERLNYAPTVPVPALPLAYHDACSLQHGQRVRSAPRELLRRAGFALREVPEGHFCCGSAGTYNLLQPTIATQLGQRKVAAIRSTDALVVAAGNLGCLVQLAHHSSPPVVHTIELLDWAAGGPRPRALDDIDLAAYPPRAPTSPLPAAPVGDEINFWTYPPTATDGEICDA